RRGLWGWRWARGRGRGRGCLRSPRSPRLALFAVLIGQLAEPGPQRPAVLHGRHFTRKLTRGPAPAAKANGWVSRRTRTAAPGARPTSRAGTLPPSRSPRPAGRPGG